MGLPADSAKAAGVGDALFHAAFVLFRLLDIFKPLPFIRRMEQLPRGLGVMMDDVVAGIVGALIMACAQLCILEFFVP